MPDKQKKPVSGGGKDPVSKGVPLGNKVIETRGYGGGSTMDKLIGAEKVSGPKG